ncbi:MAG: phosphate ABC transporter permease PstA [Ignavibacteria bacterium]|nr:phosphate ABC transporter permease PstA [Ignavibacteria bacterium]MBK7447396.1 phosphate ABC transporter permease PstA [Ignavibacteria bacterium]MBK9406123.1 phosphate ABC transporter permease PstA [Ignavibacteria bacterium]MBL0106364.1 phosphate ABC transporter permease PstA [Ignavibacteria bacterium]
MTSASIIKNPSNLRSRKIINSVMLTMCILAAVITIIPLLYIFFYTTQSGISSLNVDFFTQLPKPVGEEGGGMANAIVGSAILIGIGALIGIPVGILSGIYISEYSKTFVSTIVKFITDVLSGVPSIIVGIFAYGVIVIPMQRFSALAGGFALGILMIPTITKITEEMLKLVPQSLREASLALGVSRWKTTLKIVLKTASSGIVTGVLLAIARAAGETAPLLFTSFGNSFWQTSLDEPMAALPLQIFVYAISPYDDWHRQAWAGAFVLIFLVFVVNLLVRIVTRNKFSGNL